MSFCAVRSLLRLSTTRCVALLSTSNRMYNFEVLTKYPVAVSNNSHHIRENSTKSGSNDEPAIDLSKFAVYDEIKDLPNNPAKMLIDVREPKELEETGSIPTSINIPLKTVTENLSLSTHDFVNKYKRLKPNVHTEIIFSCRSGKRAGDACEMAKNLGFKNVKNYKGSWLEWAEKEGLNK